jgi:hypothetical protein
MIKFPCRCSHPFTLDDDMAGGMVQCPKCGLLNDVPTLSDLPSIRPDGTIELDLAPIDDSKKRLAELNEVFTPNRVDEEGHEKDLRLTMEDFKIAGDDPDLADPALPTRAPPPRYDPITGELIRAIDVKREPDDVDPEEIPLATKAIDYARLDMDQTMSAVQIPMRLLEPMNMIVILFVFMAHVVPFMLMQLAPIGWMLAVPLLIFLWPLVLGHYAVVVDEIGPEQRDELPRPLRNVSFYDDMWGPFVSMVMSLGICFGPFFMVAGSRTMPPQIQPFAMIVLAIFGVIFFPAILLTVATSGTMLNLRPDRVLGVIKKSGGQYWIAVFALLLAGSVYIPAIQAGHIIYLQLLQFFHVPIDLFTHAPVTYVALATGIILMHGFCWYLGLIYRAHHDRFPWVLQRYVSSRPRTTAIGPSVRRTRRKTADSH